MALISNFRRPIKRVLQNGLFGGLIQRTASQVWEFGGGNFEDQGETAHDLAQIRDELRNHIEGWQMSNVNTPVLLPGPGHLGLMEQPEQYADSVARTVSAT